MEPSEAQEVLGMAFKNSEAHFKMKLTREDSGSESIRH